MTSRNGAKNSSAPLAATISNARFASDDDGSVRLLRRERRRRLYDPLALLPANWTGRTDICAGPLPSGVTLFRLKLAVTMEAMVLPLAGTALLQRLTRSNRDDSFAEANALLRACE